MTSLLHDLRIALRSLRKNLGFTAVVVIALALGMAVNIGVFGIVDEILMQPLPVADPGRLVAIFTRPVSDPQNWQGLSHAEVLRLRDERQLFSGVVASSADSWVFNDGQAQGGRPVEEVRMTLGEYLDHQALGVLGLRPVLGRGFTAAEDRPGGEPVILLSHELWRTRYQGDPAIVGRKVYLNSGALTVVGVLPAGFRGVRVLPFAKDGMLYWVPLGQRETLSGTPGWLTDRAQRPLQVLARLQPGATLAQAQARADLLAGALASEFPAASAGLRMHVAPEIEGRHGPHHGTVLLASGLAMGVAGLVLIICCANVANLMLARTARRGRELGVRLALGASRGRLIRLLLTESVLLALVSAGLGLVLAYWFGDLLTILLPDLPPEAALRPQSNLRTGALALGAALLAGLGFGLLPAWRASRGPLMAVLKTDLRTEGHRLRRPGLRQLLVVAQLAISLIVLASGGLFLRSLQRMQTIDPGYQTDTLVSAQINPGLFTDDNAQMDRFFEQLLPRLEQLPGVTAVSGTLYMPLVNPQGSCGPIIKEGDPPPPPNQGKPVIYSVISARYFETMSTTLLRGRDFTRDELSGKPSTVIVNATLARQLFGSEDAAMGRRFRIGSLESAPLRIVGVARDGRYFTLLEDPQAAIFLPGFAPELHDDLYGMKTVILRSRDRASVPTIVAGLRAEVAALDARIPISDLRLGEGHLFTSMIQTRLAVGLGLILGMLALGLATMGIYSVMTYSVSQRTREIGIRVALGGQVSDVLRLVVGQGLGLVAIGVAFGSLGAWLVARALGSFLYGVSTSDPVTYLGTVALLVVVALLATLLPARRAAQVDPMVALRAD